jgi:hypothetical protein
MYSQRFGPFPNAGLETDMRSMFLAFLAIAVIAIAADLGLDRAGFSSQEASTGAAVRLD